MLFEGTYIDVYKFTNGGIKIHVFPTPIISYYVTMTSRGGMA